MISSKNHTALTRLGTNSLKQQHVHWSYDSKQLQEEPFSLTYTFKPIILTESPSARRSSILIPTESSSSTALSHFIKATMIPAGSTITNIGSSQSLILPSRSRLVVN